VGLRGRINIAPIHNNSWRPDKPPPFGLFIRTNFDNFDIRFYLLEFEAFSKSL
jgi:hypothetical protein